MPEWATNFLTEGLFAGPAAIWNALMAGAYGLLSYGFDIESESAFSYILTSAYDWFVVVGVSLINIFALVAFIRQASRLRENITTEMWVEILIKVVLGNVFMLNGLRVVGTLLDMAGYTSSLFLIATDVSIVSEGDLGAVLTYVIFGIIWLIASAVCGFYILVTIARRIANIYLLTIVMPIACSTLPGGGEIEQAGWSWLKTFLSECFEIVFIALAFLICGMLHETFNELVTSEGVAGWFDGFPQVIGDIVYMVALTATVQGAGNMLKRAFNLK